MEKFAPEKNNFTCSQNTTETSSQKLEDGSDHATLPRKEVIRRLRERGEPILLFGESELESFHRLRKCEILEPEVDKGFRNDFQEALEKVDQAFLDEIIASQQEEEGKSNLDVKVLDDGITYDEIKSKVSELGKGNQELDLQVIYQFLQVKFNFSLVQSVVISLINCKCSIHKSFIIFVVFIKNVGKST